jgi:ElaB/YqjD/DUF883 family membrane-anchored ribosome-binding protein
MSTFRACLAGPLARNVAVRAKAKSHGSLPADGFVRAASTNSTEWNRPMTDRKKKNGPKDLDKRLGALRSELDVLQGDVKGLAGDVGDVASDRVHRAIHSAENIAERAYHLAEETTTHLAGDVEDWTSNNLDSARASVRARPISAIALSLGLGALLGAIVRGR